ncbi:hypothetical protein ACIPYR_35450 [Streptomyces parvus]|uniref:hypothetical protein n=1 Tax=Streptomyces parvus TaxID=66428 RepID=UPI0037F9D83E
MRRWRSAVSTVSALALAVALSGCNDTDDSKSVQSEAEQQTSFRLGEASSPQEYEGSKKSDTTTYTVTPTRVETGTEADMKNSGLDLDELEGPRIPIFVRSTLTVTDGNPLQIRVMAGDLAMRTAQGERTKALLVMWGEATWPNCPDHNAEKKVVKGKPQEICTTFLVTRGSKPDAVELGQGWYKDPLEWPVKN